MLSVDDFRHELSAQIERATRQGRPHIEVNAGELHRTLGGYPAKAGENHSMPLCCSVMRAEQRRGNSEIVFETPSGNAASLTIRYGLPRN
ncbi:hypothetical protein [Bradyrhizobium tunisiense]|uniref:hypothetical protein n=1 Tax=Bradyrhizobium tunisiense TaxID=3278709 RepID=UPI0035DB3670